jgi:hypothetical protein
MAPADLLKQLHIVYHDAKVLARTGMSGVAILTFHRL